MLGAVGDNKKQELKKLDVHLLELLFVSLCSICISCSKFALFIVMRYYMPYADFIFVF